MQVYKLPERRKPRRHWDSRERCDQVDGTCSTAFPGSELVGSLCEGQSACCDKPNRVITYRKMTKFSTVVALLLARVGLIAIAVQISAKWQKAEGEQSLTGCNGQLHRSSLVVSLRQVQDLSNLRSRFLSQHQHLRHLESHSLQLTAGRSRRRHHHRRRRRLIDCSLCRDVNCCAAMPFVVYLPSKVASAAALRFVRIRNGFITNLLTVVTSLACAIASSSTRALAPAATATTTTTAAAVLWATCS